MWDSLFNIRSYIHLIFVPDTLTKLKDKSHFAQSFDKMNHFNHQIKLDAHQTNWTGSFILLILFKNLINYWAIYRNTKIVLATNWKQTTKKTWLWTTWLFYKFGPFFKNFNIFVIKLEWIIISNRSQKVSLAASFVDEPIKKKDETKIVTWASCKWWKLYLYQLDQFFNANFTQNYHH